MDPEIVENPYSSVLVDENSTFIKLEKSFLFFLIIYSCWLYPIEF